jgi:glutamate-1-semialdehyde 2,1-aminomutase
VKFEGGYHGMSDWGLMSLAPKRLANFPEAVPDRRHPRGVRTRCWSRPSTTRGRGAPDRGAGDEIGGVIVEPFQRLIPPAPGFLEALREVTARLGIR